MTFCEKAKSCLSPSLLVLLISIVGILLILLLLQKLVCPVETGKALEPTDLLSMMGLFIALVTLFTTAGVYIFQEHSRRATEILKEAQEKVRAAQQETDDYLSKIQTEFKRAQDKANESISWVGKKITEAEEKANGFVAKIENQAKETEKQAAESVTNINEKANETLEKVRKQADQFSELVKKAEKLDLYQTEMLLHLTGEVKGLMQIETLDIQKLNERITALSRIFVGIILERRDFGRLGRFFELLPTIKPLFLEDADLHKKLVSMMNDMDCLQDLRTKLDYFLRALEERYPVLKSGNPGGQGA